jgi:hypothetical protein
MEEIIKLFYNSLEKPTNIKGILLSPFIEKDKIVWKYENPNNLSFSTYVLETYIEDLFCDFCEQAEFTKVPSFPIFWDIDSPITLYINQELKSKIEKSLLEIKDLSLWLYNNSNLVCKSQMDYWELRQEDSYTIFLEVGLELCDIFIDNESVNTFKASKWIENYYHKVTAFLEGQQLLDEIEYMISEEETMYDESYMNIAVSIDYICPKDNHMNSLEDNKEDIVVSSEAVKFNIVPEAVTKAKLSPQEWNDLYSKMADYLMGLMNDYEELHFFSYVIKSDIVWDEFSSRKASKLIEDGWLDRQGNILKDPE